jgi:hypothetical protein
MSKSRAKRRASATLVLLVGVASIGVLWSQIAQAQGRSPAGSYTMSYWLLKGPERPYRLTPYPLTLKSDGHFTIITHLVSNAEGTWTEASNVVTLVSNGNTGPRSWIYTIHESGTDLGSKSKPGNVTVDGKPWAKWYATRTLAPRTAPTERRLPRIHKAARTTTQPVTITPEGRLLWNLEALLRTTFGASQPWSSDLTATGPTNPSNPPPNSKTGPYVDFNCSGNDCSPFSTYSPYRYTFADPTDSTFHLSQQNYKGWSFGNYPEPVLIQGRIVACNSQESSFLIRYADASSFTLACMAPLSRG